MTAHDIITVVVAAIGLLSTVVAPGIWFFKELVKYLLARIAVLEGREQTILTGLVETARAQGAEQAAQGEMVRALVKQAERERWEREREVRP